MVVKFEFIATDSVSVPVLPPAATKTTLSAPWRAHILAALPRSSIFSCRSLLSC